MPRRKQPAYPKAWDRVGWPAPATRTAPLVTINRVSPDMGRCHACPIALDAQGNLIPETRQMVEIAFASGMTLRYCEPHFAQVLAEMQAARALLGPR